MSQQEPSQPPFDRCAEASGLVTRDQIKQAYEMLRIELVSRPDEEVLTAESINAQRLADQLIEMQLLNSWQASQLLLGRTKFTLGNYLIIDSLGQGGMGQVFKAEHVLLGQPRAVKVLPIDKTTPHAVESFRREMRSQALLDHDCLVRAFDAGIDGNVHYLVTEFISGCDLRKLVRLDGPLPPMRAAHIICQVADALQYAHDQGLIHRDVKPSNVLVTPQWTAKLSDLGLVASLEGNSSDDPRHGKIVGSADYISPDQIRNARQPSPLWDVYSLGCTLYYSVTGSVPFPDRGTSLKKVMAHLDEAPVDPRELVPELDNDFAKIILNMMARNPNQRIGSAREVIERLKHWFMISVDDAFDPSEPVYRTVSERMAAAAHLVPPPKVDPPPLDRWALRKARRSSSRIEPEHYSSDLDSTGFDPDEDVGGGFAIEPMSLVGKLVLFVLVPTALLVVIMLLVLMFVY